MGRLSRFAGAAALAMMLCAPARGAESLDGVDRRTGCRARVPDAWRTLTLHWSGACVGGRAAGLGVLRAYDGPLLRAAFFGELAGGAWRFGVLDDGHGYAAGHFRDTEPVGDDDRQGVIDAFDTASRAAWMLSEDFARHGNQASADAYRRKAAQLATQMD